MWVKICGIAFLEAALWACEAGADAVGFVFAPSRRRITPELAREIIRDLPAGPEKVGVFVDEDPCRVNEIAAFCDLTMVQLHGSEGPDYLKRIELPVIKAVHLPGAPGASEGQSVFPEAAAILVETRIGGQAGGNGRSWDWSRARGLFPGKRLILAGGLNPGNVASAISQANPWGVDVSSGVEAAGQKDYGKIFDFIAAAKGRRVLQAPEGGIMR